MKQLTDEQRKIIEAADLNAVVIAGPGSGKTETIARRIARLAQLKLSDPRHMAAVTYTVAAARELHLRLLRQGIKLGYVGTLHGLCTRLLSESKAEGIPNSFGVLSEEEEKLIWQEVAKEQGAARVKTAAITLTKTDAGEPWIDDRTKWATPEMRLAGCAFKRMREIGMLSFDAILHYAIRLMVRPDWMDHPAPFTHIFVDEAQDMAWADAQIYSLLRHRGEVSLWMWGDPDQAIFGFRGGSPEHLLNFSKRFSVLTLQVNHRSGARICVAAQTVIERNADRYHKSTIPAQTNGGFAIANAVPFETEEGEAKWITQMITDHRDGTLCLPPTESIAVLTRTNFVADRIAEMLRVSGLDVMRRERVQLPDDWRFAVMLTGIALNPNELAVGRYLTARYGLMGAKRATASWASGGALAPVKRSAADIPKALASEGISRESIEFIEGVIASAPNPEDVPALMSELRRLETEPVICGGGAYVGTIHSAKGREWDTVIIPACEIGMLPHPMGSAEEERRLMFVAITRAKRNLIVTHAKTRTIRNGVVSSNQQPSPFVGDIIGDK